MSEEARLFSEGLKVLKLDTEARLVVPSDSDVASSHASASVFSTLATIREKTEKFKVQVGAGDSADAAVTFKSKELFQQRHTVAQVLGFDFCKGLKLLVHSSGCALYNETDSELVVGAKGPTPLIGYGAMSVITSAESEKFGYLANFPRKETSCLMRHAPSAKRLRGHRPKTQSVALL